MKSKRLALTFLILLVGLTGFAYAASNNVVILMNGQTQVNKETYKFLMRNFNELNLGVKLSSALDAKSIKPGDYKAIVVLNTGLSTGVDPVLKAFMDSYPNKKDIFLVTLTKDSKSMEIQSFPKASGPGGVDAVAAASAWSEGGDKMTYINLHRSWINILADFIRAK